MYKKEKTSQEWNQIRFQNSLGPQIGGLTHDAVALTIAEVQETEKGLKGKKLSLLKEQIKYWLDTLYEIAEAKKKQLTEIKPVDTKAQEEGDKWRKKHEADCKTDDIRIEEKMVEDENIPK